ncbi:CD209 antigen-like [Mytilus californianus]|uniref:CD209 antigen-like n=1 Tax=Mytilus californianus TaxID=6549 RepID=UPI00224683E8|nr:CD209 antigen-like [Mytilus californianus]
MARVAMITFLVVICTIIVEAKWKRETTESEYARIQNSVPYYWEVICDYQPTGVCHYGYIDRSTQIGRWKFREDAQKTQPPPPGPEDLKIPAPVPVSKFDRNRCKEGWYDWFGGNECYYISAFNDTKSWREAYEACKNLGADLAYAKFNMKWNFNAAGSFAIKSKIRTHYYWTSGHKVNGKWYWGNNHGPVPKSILKMNEELPGSPEYGDCFAKYLYRSVVYNKKKCNLKFNYVCQRNVPK